MIILSSSSFFNKIYFTIKKKDNCTIISFLEYPLLSNSAWTNLKEWKIPDLPGRDSIRTSKLPSASIKPLNHALELIKEVFIGKILNKSKRLPLTLIMV